jgi:putative molybdopterin biosynthesis protein
MQNAHPAAVRPSPQVAYSQWIDVCTDAGWSRAISAEQVAVRDALGRVTAAPVHACWSVPRYACAAMDGIAISASSIPSDADSAARWQLAARSFTPVDTGEPMPPGTDTVLVRERVEHRGDGSALVSGPARRGLHVRPVGEDIQAGQLLLPAGHRLRPADLAALAAAGRTTLQVARRPVVAVIPTGDEIQPIGSAPRPDGVVDCNSLMLALRAAEAGAAPVVSAVQPDEPGVLAAELLRAALSADLVLVIAGSSAGRRDYTAAAIAGTGGLAVRGVAVRPGHPVLLGYAIPRRTGDPGPALPVPVIGVPGYPLAAAVIFELFAVPLLAALTGRPAAGHVWQQVQLACGWTSAPDIEDWVPVSLTSVPAGRDGDCALVATPYRRGAGAISQLLSAGGWWPIPIGQSRFAAGEHIRIHPLAG